MKDVGIRLRVEKELREEFSGACKMQGKRAAEVLRNFMRDYVLRESAGMQGSLFSKPSMSRDAAVKSKRSRKRK